MYPRLPTLITGLLMLGMFLLEFKVPILLAIAGTGAALLGQLLYHMRMDRVGAIVLLNYTYWLWSAFVTGAFSLMDLVSPDFLAGDGRIMVSYLPFLFYSVVAVRDGDIRALHQIFVTTAILTFLLFLVWAFTRAAILSEGASGHFVGFLTSHTGGGTFFGVLAVMLILYGIESRRRMTALLGWMTLFPLLASGSRQSLLAFFVVMGWYVAKRKEWKKLIYAMSFLAMLLTVAPFVAPEAWARTAGLFTWDLVEGVAETIRTSDWKPGDGEDELDLAGTQVNVLFRVTIWTYAIGRFLDSPFFGIGFGRYNDYDLEFWGMPGLLFIAVDGFKIIGASNAHNSYIHVLCEGGLLGIGLLMWLWISVYFRLRRRERDFSPIPDLRAMAIAAEGEVVFALTAALTGHALAAPSFGLPAIVIIGSVLAYQRLAPRKPRSAGLQKDAAPSSPNRRSPGAGPSHQG